MDIRSHTTRPPHLPAFSLLLARYVSGQITDTIWDQLMHILDADETPLEERVALVNFVSDAWEELGLDTVRLPRLEEIEELRTNTRA